MISHAAYQLESTWQKHGNTEQIDHKTTKESSKFLLRLMQMTRNERLSGHAWPTSVHYSNIKQ